MFFKKYFSYEFATENWKNFALSELLTVACSFLQAVGMVILSFFILWIVASLGLK